MECPLPSGSNREVPRLHHRNPQELHWREPEEDSGTTLAPEGSRGDPSRSLGRALRHLYPHLAGETCCLQCGATPCPYDHAEDRRVRLVDLEFVKELARERKELLAQLTQLTQELNSYKRLETDWRRQRDSMEGELERLRDLNKDHMKEIAKYRKEADKCQAMSRRLETLEGEYKRLAEEKKKCDGLISRQVQDIAKLEATQRSLHNDLDKRHTEVRRLRVELHDAAEDRSKLKAELEAQAKLVQQYNENLDLLNGKLRDEQMEHQALKASSEERILELSDQIVALESSLIRSNQENEDLNEMINNLLRTIEDLKARLSADQRFRQFVNIKREVNQLKDQNESLAQFCVHNPPVMPVMKQNGRVTASDSHVKLTAQMTLEAADVRPSRARSAVLRRPKSSRGFIRD